MIYITGDTHGNYYDFEDRLSKVNPQPDDTVIVCGDFGFVWGDNIHENFLNALSDFPFTIAFIDGNHENFDLLYQYPVVEWNGGKIHKVRDNIFHLMRGECFTIEGYTFFCFGGAYSIDKMYRRPYIEWWSQEQPNNAEYNNARRNLEFRDYKVDYVLTHTIPDSFIYRLKMKPDRHDAQLTGYLEWLCNELDFRHWFAGHFHEDIRMDDLTIMYHDIKEFNYYLTDGPRIS